MADNETIADIAAEMRGARTEFPFVYLMGEVDTPAVIDFRTQEILEPRKINIRRVTVKELADRIEAAHKRERGDAAKLREAVALALSLLDLKEGVPYKTISQKDIDFIKAALAAPPRNCDRYPHDIALRIWLAKPDDPMNGSFDEWLYAPATEKEGGNNG